MKDFITLPVDMLVNIAKNDRQEQEYYIERNNVPMANWHEGRAIAIETLIDVWARD